MSIDRPTGIFIFLLRISIVNPVCVGLSLLTSPSRPILFVYILTQDHKQKDVASDYAYCLASALRAGQRRFGSGGSSDTIPREMALHTTRCRIASWRPFSLATIHCVVQSCGQCSTPRREWSKTRRLMYHVNHIVLSTADFVHISFFISASKLMRFSTSYGSSLWLISKVSSRQSRHP